MAKSRKRVKAKSGAQNQVEILFDKARSFLLGGHAHSALRLAQQGLLLCSKQDALRAEALELLGTALGRLNKFEASYQRFSEALAIHPDDFHLLYNRGISARLTFRSGQSLLDLQKAASLVSGEAMADKVARGLKTAEEIVRSNLEMRGADFTLENLVEQQECFAQGNNLSEKGKWQDAESLFRKVIALADCLPQPWGNLGICLLMQQRFDEAEEAFQRALEIDPEYARAKENQALLTLARENPDIQPGFAITSPFDDLKTTLTPVK